MKHDITGNIADFVIEANPDLVGEMEKQKQHLRQLECCNPFYGGWVEMGIEYLFSVFELEDPDFAARLPAVAHLNKSSRRDFIKGMKRHLRDCEHCALKHQHELEVNARIEESCRENRQSLIEQLGVKTAIHPADCT